MLDDVPASAPAAEFGELDGPWEQAWWFSVPVPVRSKGNFRRSNRRPKQWSALVKFEDDIAVLARRACPAGWEMGDISAKRVADRPAVVSFIFARTTLDTANLAKSVHDACQGIAFHRDSSVCYSAELAERTGRDQRGLVAYARLAPGSATPAALAAGAALAAAVAHLLD